MALRRPVATVVMAASAIVLTGCGSTAQPITTPAGGVAAPSGSDGLSAPGDSGLTAPGGVPTQPLSPDNTTGTGPEDQPSRATGRPATRPPGRPTPGTAPASGVNSFKGPIKVGIPVADTAAIAAVFGKQSHDATQSPKRIVAYINKHGGIDGHPIQPIFFKVNSGSDAATVQQQACNAFTVDHKIDIMIGGGDDTGCLAKKGISAIAPGLWAPDSAMLAQHPNTYYTDALALDRAISIEMRYSASHGQLRSGSHLGVIVEDCPADQRVARNTVAPLAKQLGLSVTLATVQCVDNLVADITPVTVQSQNAVLKFKVNRVSSVMIISSAEAFILAQFSQAANRQKYYPHYIVSSNAYPYGNSQPNATIQISQTALPNITGLGTLPYLDVGPLARPVTTGQRAAQARCRAADPGEGIARGEKTNGRYFDLAGFYAACDGFFLMKAVLEYDLEHGLGFGLSDVAKGFSAVLSDGRTPSAALAAGVFSGGTGRRDCAGTVRPFAYDKAHRTFRYVGKPISVG